MGDGGACAEGLAPLAGVSCYRRVNDQADILWNCREALRLTCGDRVVCDAEPLVIIRRYLS